MDLMSHAGDAEASTSKPVTSTAPRGFGEYLESTRHQPIYVILGVQGSGTNLLARLLTSMFGFSVMRDRSAVFKAAARLGPHPTQADITREMKRFTKLVQPSRLRRRFSKNVMRNRAPLQGLTSEVLPPLNSGADFARLIYAYRAFSLGASQIGIKSDDLWEHIQHIDEVLPNRRIIMLTRDFRDNLMSISAKNFGPIEPLCAAQYVKHQLGYYIPEFRRSGPTAYHVTYEALLNDTRRLVDDLSAYFKLEPGMHVDAAIAALKFRPNKIGKWKVLSQRDLAWCEGLLYNEMLEFGYQPSTPAPVLAGPGQCFLATARDKVKRVPQKLRRLRERMGN